MGTISNEIYQRDANCIAEVEKLRFYPLVPKSGKGAMLTDEDDREYLDFTANWAVANTGYCHPHIVEAIAQATSQLTFTSLTSFTSKAGVELAEKLIAMTPGDFPKKVWYGHSGSEANECIAKVIPLASNRPRMISFVGSYHGQTGGALSLSGHPAQAKFIGGGHVTKVPYPFCYRCPYEKNRDDCQLFCLRFFEDYILQCQVPADQVGGVIVEAVQSDGGDIVPPKGFLTGLQECCQRHGIWLILDEVKVGIGRTGRDFGFSKESITPDAVILGKPLASGIPLSAIVARKEIMDCATGIHMFTTAGNPIACHAGLATLEILENEQLCQKAAETGALLLALFHNLKTEFSCIGDVRGDGMILGIDLVENPGKKIPASKLAAMVTYRAYELGLLIFTSGIFSNVLEITPPLVLSEAQARRGVDILRTALQDAIDNKVDSAALAKFAGWATN